MKYFNSKILFHKTKAWEIEISSYNFQLILSVYLIILNFYLIILNFYLIILNIIKIKIVIF